MINLIERFIEDTEKMNVCAIIDKESNDNREVYFFMGKNSVLCIDKKDDKIIYNIKYDKMQIQILNANEFCFNIEGKPLLFYQGNVMHIKRNTKTTEKEKFKKAIEIVEETNARYRYKEICDRCENKKCNQYDTINGREFKFGSGPISEDLLQQYDRYCQNKIERFGCLN
jgi:predicted metal-dependent hydrolase